MLIKNATLAQNILFILALVGILLAGIFFILKFFKKQEKQIVTSDDIDSNTESFENITGFLYHAFSLEGSIVFFAFASSFSFLMSCFVPLVWAIIIGVVVGVVLTILFAFVQRTPIIEIGETAVVSVDIPDNGQGKIILTSDNSEIIATSLSGAIKKGKDVIIVSTENNIATVRKIKKH